MKKPGNLQTLKFPLQGFCDDYHLKKNSSKIPELLLINMKTAFLKTESYRNAPKEKVWNVLWNDTTYKKWTSVFSEGSHAETDWNEGSKVLFLDGKGQGMVSMIASKKPNVFMSFKHLGTIKDGVEDMDSDETKKWSGSMET